MAVYTEINIPDKEFEKLKPIDITLDELIPDEALPVEDLPQEDEAPVDEAPVKKIPVEDESKKAHRVSRAQKRIKELLTEKQMEASRAAELAAENEELRKQLNREVKGANEAMKGTLVDNINSLKRELAAAIQSGEDSAQIVDLQVQLQQAVNQLQKATDLTAQYEVEEKKAPVESKKQQAPQQVPEAAREWVANRPEFNSDPMFAQMAILVNNMLIQEGYDPTSDDFYDELDTRLAPRFPEVFGTQEKNPVQYSESPDEEAEKASHRKPKAVTQTMSGQARSAVPPSQTQKPRSNTVTLTPEELHQAEKWNMSYETMAKRKLNLETNKDHNGYTPIFIPSEKR